MHVVICIEERWPCIVFCSWPPPPAGLEIYYTHFLPHSYSFFFLCIRQKPFTEDPSSEGSNLLVWFGSLYVLPSPWMYWCSFLSPWMLKIFEEDIWFFVIQIEIVYLLFQYLCVSDTSILSLSKWRKKGVEPRIYSSYDFKSIMSRDFLPPSPWGSFRIFSKIRGDIRKSRCTTPVSKTPAVNNSDTILLTPVKLKTSFVYMLTLLTKGFGKQNI